MYNLLFFSNCIDLFIGSTETKYIKPNTETQNNIVFLEFFIESDIVILAFFEKNWLKYKCLKKISWFGLLVF